MLYIESWKDFYASFIPSITLEQFGFIEFLHTHSWHGETGLMRMIDEDEVGLNEKPEDTRYIKKITSK